MKSSFFILVMLFAFSRSSVAKESSESNSLSPTTVTSPDSVTVVTSTSDDEYSFVHRLGLGASNFPQNDYGTRPNATPGPMLSIRYWISRKWSTEFGLGFAESFADSGYFDASSNPEVNQFYAYEENIAFKYNLKHPVKYVWIQAIVELAGIQDWNFVYKSYSTASNPNFTAASWSMANYVFSGYLGIGFEAFLPFWSDLSIEGSIGLNPGGTLRWNPIQNDYFWVWAIESNDTGLQPLNASVHYYF